MARIFLVLTAAALIAGCAMAPTVTKRKMTLAEAGGLDGLVCRTAVPAGTNIPQTICASETAWAAYDERREQENRLILEAGRLQTNAGPFNRQ